MQDLSHIQLDERPGFYYATVLDGQRTGFLLGPFTTHREALDAVPVARRAAARIDCRADWYAYGTARLPLDYINPPSGRLNALARAIS
jgi:hypothetical protein